jgi:hypothetical protein
VYCVCQITLAGVVGVVDYVYTQGFSTLRTSSFFFLFNFDFDLPASLSCCFSFVTWWDGNGLMWCEMALARWDGV